MAAALAAVAVGGATHAAVNRPAPGSRPVVVATAPVPVGAPLAGSTEVRQLDPAAVPEGALEGLGEVGDLTAATTLVPGEIVTTSDLRLARVLGTEGSERAVFLPVAEPAVLAMLTPGDRVDVHSSVDGTAVLEEVTVLAVHPGDRQEGGAWVAATTGQSAALAAARGADPLGSGLVVALLPPQ